MRWHCRRLAFVGNMLEPSREQAHPTNPTVNTSNKGGEGLHPSASSLPPSAQTEPGWVPICWETGLAASTPALRCVRFHCR